MQIYDQFHIKNNLDSIGYSLESGEYCYVSYRSCSSSPWTTENIIGDITYLSEMDYLITLPDTDEYNDGWFEIEIGNSGQDSADYCWFGMVEMYGYPISSPTTEPTIEPTIQPTTLAPTTDPLSGSSTQTYPLIL